MVIKKVENKLEKFVEGTFAKFFSSELKPVEISRKIVREIELNRSIGVHGDYLAPNDFDVVISMVLANLPVQGGPCHHESYLRL